MELTTNGSIVATIGNSLFAGTTVFLLVIHEGEVIDQVRLHKGVGFFQDFVGMDTQDLQEWRDDDQSFSAFPEERKLINSYDEPKEVIPNVTRHSHSSL